VLTRSDRAELERSGVPYAEVVERMAAARAEWLAATEAAWEAAQPKRGKKEKDKENAAKEAQ
jgi:hypothetical protein